MPASSHRRIRRLRWESLERRDLLAVSAVISLGPVSLSPSVATFPVDLEYQATAGERLAYFSLDLAPSSASLIGPGPDFSAFSFSRASPLLDGWRQIGFLDDPGFESTVEFDDQLVASLAPGTYRLGSVTVDLASAGILAGQSFTVAINGAGTVVGVSEPGVGFGFRPVTFQPASRQVAALTLSGPAETPEGGAYPLVVTALDRPVGTLILDWGDGSTSALALADLPADGRLSHPYRDGPANATITATIELPDGSRFDGGSLSVTIRNVAPQVPLTGNSSVLEGALYELALGEIVEPGADTVTRIHIQWGDGQSESLLATALPANRRLTHRYSDGPAQATIVVDLEDEDGRHAAAGQLQIQVANVAPQATLRGDAEVLANTPYSVVIGEITDPGVDTITEISIDWGDNQRDTLRPDELPANRTLTHIYRQAGATPVIRLLVSDEDGPQQVAGTLPLRILPNPPIVDLQGPSSVTIGTPYRLVVGPIRGGDGLPVDEYRISWGDGTEIQIPAEQFPVDRELEHTYERGPADVVITVTLISELGEELNRLTLPVIILGEAMVLDSFETTAGVPGATVPGETVTATATFTYLGSPGTFSALIDWGDGSEPEAATVVLDGTTGRATDTHQYSTGGVFPVSIRIRSPQDDLREGTATTFLTGVRLSQRVIQIVGGDQNDLVTVTPQGSDAIFVNLTTPPLGNFRLSFPRSAVAGLEILVAGGEDRVMVSDRLQVPTYIHGGPGDDHVQGGDGPNLVLGGPGRDWVLGGDDRDVLLGGQGEDRLLGYSGDDVVAGSGETAGFSARLGTVAAWNSSEAFAVRLAAVLAFLELDDDETPDWLYGGLEHNLYYASAGDQLIDAAAEIQTSLEDIWNLDWVQEIAQAPGVYGAVPLQVSLIAPLQAEPESVDLRAATPHATRDSQDVNGDGLVTPQDVIVVINYLNEPAGRSRDRLWSLDTNQDGAISPQDVLGIVNRLNGARGNGEGEASGQARPDTAALARALTDWVNRDGDRKKGDPSNRHNRWE